ncbi:excalibur calcium-binding domain-containing protein [Williamsia sp. M5A3_1d]
MEHVLALAPANTPPVPAVGAGEPYYSTCDDARAAGTAPIHAGAPGYRLTLDRKNDGVACENKAIAAARSANRQQPTSGPSQSSRWGTVPLWPTSPWPHATPRRMCDSHAAGIVQVHPRLTAGPPSAKVVASAGT